MSKIKKIGIFLCIIFVSIFFILGIKALSGFVILNNIIKAGEENILKDNYSLKTVLKAGEKTSQTQAFYRNGIGVYIAENGVFTWTDGEDAYMIDEDEKIVYVLNITNSSEMLVSGDKFAYLIPGYKNKFIEKVKICGNIKSEKLEDIDCYKIVNQEEKYEKTTWINKITLNPVKTVMKFPSGEILEYTHDIKFTSVKLTTIELPNIEGYKVINYDTQEVITENFTVEEENN